MVTHIDANLDITLGSAAHLKELIDKETTRLHGPITATTVLTPVDDGAGNPYRVQLTLSVGQASTLRDILDNRREDRHEDLDSDISSLYDLATSIATVEFPIINEKNLKRFVDDHIRQRWSCFLTKKEIDAGIEDNEDRWNDHMSDKR